MYNFPNPSTGSTVIDGLGNTRQFDPTVRTPTTAGYQQRVLRATWVPKKFMRTLRGISDAEKTSIETHEQNVNYGQDTFAWEDEQASIVYMVAFDESALPIEMQPDGRNDQWQCELAFVQTSSVELTTGDYGYGVYGIGNYLG